MAAAELESVRVHGKDFTSLFQLISTPPPTPRFFGGKSRCVGTFDLQNIPLARGMGKKPLLFSEGGKNPELTIPVGGKLGQ